MCCRVLRHSSVPAQPGASPGAPQVATVSFAVSHLSLTLGHAESKGRTWQPGKLSLPILLLQIRAQLHRSSCASLVRAAGSPSSGGFGEERTFTEGFASSGFFLCFEEHPAQLCTLSLCLPFLCKVSLFKHGTSEGHLSTPSSVTPPRPVSPVFPCAAAIWGSTVGKGTRGPQGFLQLLPLSGTFFSPSRFAQRC